MQFTTNKPFEPISIHLTTQAEVDFFYTLVANAPDVLVGDYGLGAEVGYLTSFLADSTSEEYFDNFEVGDYYPDLSEPLDDFCQFCGSACQGGCAGTEAHPQDTRCTYSGAEFYDNNKPAFNAAEPDEDMYNDMAIFFQTFNNNKRK